MARSRLGLADVKAMRMSVEAQRSLQSGMA